MVHLLIILISTGIAVDGTGGFRRVEFLAVRRHLAARRETAGAAMRDGLLRLRLAGFLFIGKSGRLTRRLGRAVELTLEVDASLLGGAIIRADDMVIDGSVRTRLQRLTESLIG